MLSKRLTRFSENIAGHRWQLIEMPDRGFAMIKMLLCRDGEQIIVLVRSNSILIYEPRKDNAIPLPDDLIMRIAAHDVSLEFLATILIPRDAAECAAVFKFNRRNLIYALHREN